MAYTFSKHPRPLKKNEEGEAALQRLRSYLDANEPRLIRWLVYLWNEQGKAITYKELRQAILLGDISPQWLYDWQQDYSRFVVQRLAPEWEKAMQAAAAHISTIHPDWHFDPAHEGIRQWTATRSAEFVTNVTQTQIDGLRAVIRRGMEQGMTPDELSRVLRPMLGLQAQQATANLNYYKTLKEAGMAEKKAQDLAAKYAGRQHRWRGQLVARTELGTGYNAGAYYGVKQAQEKGYMGETVKRWSTAADERVCTKICGPLDGVVVGMDEEFTVNGAPHKAGNGLVGIGHPGCRCAVQYIDLDTLTPQEQAAIRAKMHT